VRMPFFFLDFVHFSISVAGAHSIPPLRTVADTLYTLQQDLHLFRGEYAAVGPRLFSEPCCELLQVCERGR
jgi:hypothetical protein